MLLAYVLLGEPVPGINQYKLHYDRASHHGHEFANPLQACSSRYFCDLPVLSSGPSGIEHTISWLYTIYIIGPLISLPPRLKPCGPLTLVMFSPEFY